MGEKPTFIDIRKDGIKFGFHLHYIKEEDGMYSFHIPAYNIHYSAPSFEEGDRRSVIMVSSFFNFWVLKQGFRQFVLQIFKLGFKTQNHDEFKRLLNRTDLNARLSSKNWKIPAEFANYETSSQTGELSVAV